LPTARSLETGWTDWPPLKAPGAEDVATRLARVSTVVFLDLGKRVVAEIHATPKWETKARTNRFFDSSLAGSHSSTVFFERPRNRQVPAVHVSPMRYHSMAGGGK